MSRFTLIFVLILGVIAFGRQADNDFARGGQFKDLILPMPIIDGLESRGIWGNENVVPRDADNGIEDAEWCYWGGNPILGNEGKYHLAVCRWKENTGHNGWFHAEVAHCVSDSPIGPYKITGTIVKEAYNPEVMKLADGTFALHIHTNQVLIADDMGGPWEKLGWMKMDARGFRLNNRLGSNLTTEYRPDGSFIVMTKGGDIAISNKGLLGPYQMVSINNYTRSTGYPEDPVIWRSRHQYHAIYNHAQDRKSGYMRSIDGVHWKNEDGLPYDASTTFYEDGTKNVWYKFERPKVLLDDLGRATHLSLAVMDVAKSADKGDDNHSSKNMIMPLVVEKLITILNKEPITKGTQKITVKIEAEEGFNPSSDLDIESLRFGSDSLVNYGKGCVATNVQKAGNDIIVTFEGENGINHNDFDLKMLGKTNSGELVFGYALLPGRSIEEASLIALPIQIKETDGKKVLESAVENCGLSDSIPCKAEIRQYSKAGLEILQTIDIAEISPYKSVPISVSLNEPAIPCEYEIVILGDNHYDELWQRVDDTGSSVAFEGNWKLREKEDNDCFLDNEMVSETIGDSVKFTFTGTGAKVYGRLGRDVGSYDVFIDGKFIEKIRCGWSPTANAPIYKTSSLPAGEHELKLVKSESEYMGEVTIDGFAYEIALPDSKHYHAAKGSLQNYNVPDWYQDAKFGVWPIWGVYSVPAYAGKHAAEWYGIWMHCVEKEPETIKLSPKKRWNDYYDLLSLPFIAHHNETYGNPKEFGYHDFMPMWKAEKWSPDDWAQITIDAGAKFLCMMGTFHDGISLYDSELTEWDTVDKGPKRDLCADMKKALYARGLKFGLSNHFAWNYGFFKYYHNNGYAQGQEEYADLYSENSTTDEKYMKRWWDRTIEMVDKCDPDLYYFDWGWHGQSWLDGKYHEKFAAYFYNHAIDSGKGEYGDPGVVLNSKFSPMSSYCVRDLERGKMASIQSRTWQTDTSISVHSWGYSTIDEYYSTNHLIDTLVDIVSKNGVLMLAFGPRADGTVPDEYYQRLMGMGQWLKVNGEAVYSTRPYQIYGEGPAPKEGHESHEVKPYSGTAVRFTRNKDNNVLYAIALEWPGKELCIKSLARGKFDTASIQGMRMLGTSESLEWKQDEQGLKIAMPAEPSYGKAYPVRIQFADKIPAVKY